MQLTQSCEELKGVGPSIAKKLAKCGIYTLQDLLFHLPYKYQDRTRITPIQDLRSEDWAVVVGQVYKTEIKYGKKMMLNCYIQDKTGFLKLRFFHFNKQQIQTFNQHPHISIFGLVKGFGGDLEIIHPEYKILNSLEDFIVDEALTPIYPATEGLSQTKLRQLIQQVLLIAEEAIKKLEWMNTEQLTRHHFQPIYHSLHTLHYPAPDLSPKLLLEGCHPALKRLAFDELTAFRISMHFARQERAQSKAPALKQFTLSDQLITLLPFKLTTAQHRVYQEMRQELQQSLPMLRLVQGDVGSGKTVIAALAALQAVANGYQAALMAPTELLSEQHFQTLTPWLSALGVSTFRLNGKMRAKERKQALQALADGTAQVIIGTHALFQEEVIFAKLGLIIIDEQHRFGVQQRLNLHRKGQKENCIPHQLLLTATPIPRTLAMTQFAHLDLSILDEKPPGRTAVTTAIMHQDKREPIIQRLKAAILAGKQAYWVCTLIEDSEKLQCIAATETATYLQTQLPDIRVGLIHGRMKSSEKEMTMLQFKQGNIDLLVATTVIEVGVDVPNASLMIIENAERLGLFQLHQLRGRIGRGSTQSYCLLLYQMPLSRQSAERLKVMKETTDGFIIAEKDLALRGAGEILGTQQTGYRAYKIATLPRDHDLLETIVETTRWLAHQPELAKTIARRWLGQFEQFLQG